MEFVYKLYEKGGYFKITEDAIYRKIYEDLIAQSCLKGLLQLLHTTISDINYISQIDTAHQQSDYPQILVNIDSFDEKNEYVKEYTFTIRIVSSNFQLPLLNLSELIETELEGLVCIKRLNEMGPRLVGSDGNANIYEVIQYYKYLCGSNAE